MLKILFPLPSGLLNIRCITILPRSGLLSIGDFLDITRPAGQNKGMVHGDCETHTSASDVAQNAQATAAQLSLTIYCFAIAC